MDGLERPAPLYICHLYPIPRYWFISSHSLQSTVKGSEGQSGRNLEQDLRQRPWRKVAYWLAALGVFSGFLYNPED